MKIIDWEMKIRQKYKIEFITNINDLKSFLMPADNYADCFTIYEITEGEVENEDFYAAYVFDERELYKKDVIPDSHSGWKTTVIFIGSHDAENICSYCVHGYSYLTREEIYQFREDLFLNEIDASLRKQ